MGTWGFPKPRLCGLPCVLPWLCPGQVSDPNPAPPPMLRPPFHSQFLKTPYTRCCSSAVSGELPLYPELKLSQQGHRWPPGHFPVDTRTASLLLTSIGPPSLRSLLHKSPPGFGDVSSFSPLFSVPALLIPANMGPSQGHVLSVPPAAQPPQPLPCPTCGHLLSRPQMETSTSPSAGVQSPSPAHHTPSSFPAERTLLSTLWAVHLVLTVTRGVVSGVLLS